MTLNSVNLQKNRKSNSKQNGKNHPTSFLYDPNESQDIYQKEHSFRSEIKTLIQFDRVPEYYPMCPKLV